MNLRRQLAVATSTAALAVAVALPGPAAAQGPAPARAAALSYEVVDLGARGPGYASVAMKLNDRSVVVGVLGNRLGPDNCPAPCAYPWGNPAMFGNGRTPKALNDLNAWPTGINSTREVIGAVGAATPVVSAFHWKAGITTLIPDVQLLAINDASTAVGSAGSAAVKFEAGNVVVLGTWGADAAVASAIDEAGTVFGYRTFNAVPLIDGVRVSPDGTVHSLSPPLPAGRSTVPTAANRIGDVVGRYSLDGSHTLGFAIIGGQHHRIEWPGGAFTGPLAINDAGTVVGFYETPTLEDRAFLWSKGSIVDLGSLPEVAAAGWTHLVTANDINKRGVIVGWGIRSTGEQHAYMLIPRRR